MVADFRGPYHADRCDVSIFPYAGVRVKSELVPLANVPPYDQIKVCRVSVGFDKQNLKTNDKNLFRYTYRHTDDLGDYLWAVNVFFNPVLNRFVPQMVQLPHAANKMVVGNNLDRTQGPSWVECNEITSKHYERNGLQGFGVEGPLAKVVGGKLHVSFFVTGLTCDTSAVSATGWGWNRRAMPMARSVILGNAAGSKIGYDGYRTFSRPIDEPGLVENKVEFEMPLKDVMDDDQWALYNGNGKSGKPEIGLVKFTIRIGTVGGKKSPGFVSAYFNLDPLDAAP